MLSECIWMSGKDAADRAWACLVLLGLGQLTPCLDRYLHLLGICSLEPSPVDRCPQLLSKNVNRVCFLVLNSSRGRHGDTSFTGEWCDQNSCSEISFQCEEMKMFLSSLCKSCFPRKDGAWRLKPGSQEQLNGLESEHLSLAARTRKWSQGGKALCLFASLLFSRLLPAMPQWYRKSWESRVKPQVCALLAMAGRSL